MNLIVNVDKNWAIGKDNKLLFRLSQDMKFFRNHTTDNIIIMGRRTLESFPGSKPLPNRTNIVLSRQKGYAPDGVTVCHGTDELAQLLKDAAEDIYVIGGESVYRELLPLCGTAYVTKVDAAADSADSFMVNLDESPDWELEEESEELEEKGIKFRFVKYKRK